MTPTSDRRRIKVERLEVEKTGTKGDKPWTLYNDGEPVGTLGWNGLEWWFYPLTFDLSAEGEPLHIDVDYEQRRRFAEEREAVATAPEGGVRDARMAELDARIRLHRDETRELALMRARLEAKRAWRRRRY
jgi:hypothetical protein